MLKLDFEEIDIYNIGSWPLILKIIATIGVSILTVIVFNWLFISAKVEKLEELSAEKKKLKQSFESKERLIVNINEYKEQLKVIHERLSNLVKLLPSENEVPNLVDHVSQAGRESGLKFKEITMLPEKKLNYYVELPIQIKATGSYHQIGDFISKVSGLLRIITFHDFTLELNNDPNKTKAGRDHLELDILAKTYRYLPKSDTNDAEGTNSNHNKHGDINNNKEDVTKKDISKPKL